MSDSNPSSAEFDDVRMRGFRSRVPVADALRWVDHHAQTVDSEVIPLSQAAGRILAEEVFSPLDVPAYRRAMMDGYAVQAIDTFGASGYNPLPLSVVDGSFSWSRFGSPVSHWRGDSDYDRGPVARRCGCGHSCRKGACRCREASLCTTKCRRTSMWAS